MPRKLVGYDGGKPGASSRPDRAKWAFISFVPVGTQCYGTERENLPFTIWYNFRRPIRVVKMGFSNCKATLNTIERSPQTISLVGSHDCDDLNFVTWVNLIKIKNAGFEVKPQFRSWEIPEPKSYSCYGIHIENTNGENANYVHIRNILMWENMHDY